MKREFNQLKWEETLVFQGPQGYETGSQQSNMGTTLILSNQSDKHCYEYIYICYNYVWISSNETHKIPSQSGELRFTKQDFIKMFEQTCFFFAPKTVDFYGKLINSTIVELCYWMVGIPTIGHGDPNENELAYHVFRPVNEFVFECIRTGHNHAKKCDKLGCAYLYM